MAHGITGAAVAANVDGGVWNIKVTRWRFTERVEQVEDTASGDIYVSKLATFGDYDVELEGEVPDQAARHVINANETHLGTAVAWALKEKASDVNPKYSGTGMAHEFEEETNLKGVITVRLRINCSEGVGITHDTTPLS